MPRISFARHRPPGRPGRAGLGDGLCFIGTHLPAECMLECTQLAVIDVAGNLGQGSQWISSQQNPTVATKFGALSSSTSRSKIRPGLRERGSGHGSNRTVYDSASAVGKFFLEDWGAVQRMRLQNGWLTEVRGLGATFLMVEQSPTLFILDDGRYLSKWLFRSRGLETALASGSLMPGRHSAASISVYFVELDPGEGVATAPVRDSALVGLLPAVRLVLTRTSACDAYAVLAYARSRQMPGSSGGGLDLLSWSWECRHWGAWRGRCWRLMSASGMGLRGRWRHPALRRTSDGRSTSWPVDVCLRPGSDSLESYCSL